MTALIDADRIDTMQKFVRKIFVEAAATANMDTLTIKAAVDAADDWCDTNAAAFNTALPTTFKNTATLAQKSLLLAYVVMKRGGIL